MTRTRPENPKTIKLNLEMKGKKCTFSHGVSYPMGSTDGSAGQKDRVLLHKSDGRPLDRFTSLNLVKGLRDVKQDSLGLETDNNQRKECMRFTKEKSTWDSTAIYC